MTAGAPMSSEQLVEELEKVITSSEEARRVVREAGFPAGSVPELKRGQEHWWWVVDQAAHGRITGRVPALARAAASLYPGNAVFAAFAGEGEREKEGGTIAGDAAQTITQPRWSVERERIEPFPGHDAKPPETRERPELIVIGQREGDWVRLRYRTGHHAEPFEERVVGWDPELDRAERILRSGSGTELQALGLRLGLLLLGEVGDPQHQGIARALFRAPPDERTTVLGGKPARCRLVLDEMLEALPWRLTAMRDRDGLVFWLTDEGWTFEHGAPGRSELAVSLPNPCSIMFVVPQHGRLHTAGAVLVERAMERLGAMWPRERSRLDSRVAVVHGHGEALRELQERTRPEVVVVLGRVVSLATPSLEFKTGAGEHGTSEIVGLERFVEELAEAEVKVAVLASTGAVSLPRGVRGRLPCVLVPGLGGGERDVVETVLSWLWAMLAEGLDPVQAIHRKPAEEPSRWWCGMRAHADFRSWITPPAVSAEVDVLARRRIDRDEPRALFIRHVTALVKDERRRVEAFVAHGRPADKLEWLGDQLWQEYMDAEPPWRAYRQRVPFPEGVASEAVLRDQFERILIEALELEEDEALPTRVAEIAKERGWPHKPFVYWLDFEAQLDGISVGVLEGFMRMAKLELPQLVKGLDRIRVVSTLGVVPAEPMAFQEITGDLARTLQSDRVSLTAFAALGRVRVEHLERYLRDPRITRCPERLVPVVAEVIVERSRGDFDEVIATVEAAERGNGWLSLAEDRPGPRPPRKLDRNRKI